MISFSARIPLERRVFRQHVMSFKNTPDSKKHLHKLSRVYMADLKNMPSKFQLDCCHVHHLTTVLRLRKGDHFRAFNIGGEYLCVVEDIISSKRAATELFASIVETVKSPTRDDGVSLHLYISPIRPKNMKKMVELATEVGVTSITPVIFQNTNTKFDQDVQESLVRHAISATEQCERLSVPLINRPISLEALSRAPLQDCEHLMVCQERSAGSTSPILASLSNILSNSKMNSDKRQLRLGVLVGPEGGFVSSELELLQKNAVGSVHMVSLGSNVMRSETAVTVALGCIQNSLL